MTDMTVSQLGQRAGVSSDTIRYYERIGLLPDVDRSPAGYRLFTDADVERMAFIRRSQELGLQLDQISVLLGVQDQGLCPCGHARDLLTQKLVDLDEQMETLSWLRRDIESLLDADFSTGTPWPCAPGLSEEDSPTMQGGNLAQSKGI